MISTSYILIIIIVYHQFKGKQNDDLPNCIEDEEWVVEHGLLRVVLQCEEDGIAEPDPCYETQGDEAVPWRALVQVQHLTRVKELQHQTIAIMRLC